MDPEQHQGETGKAAAAPHSVFEPEESSIRLPTESATTTEDTEDIARYNSDADYSIFAVLLLFMVPSLGGFLFGYDISATSFVLRALTVDQGDTSWSLIVHEYGWSSIIASSAVWQGIIVSLSSFGALLSSCILFLQNDWIGRRTELQLGALLYTVGALLESLAGIQSILESPSGKTKMLGLFLFVAGRVIFGFGIGVSMHAAPTYLGEMGPSPIRGILVSLKEACIVLGIVMGYTLGFLFTQWKYTYGSSMVPSLTMLVLATYAIPESCRWLLLQGTQQSEAEALKALQFVFPFGQTAMDQLVTIRTALQQEGLVRSSTNVGDNEHGRDEVAPLLVVPYNPSRSVSWKTMMTEPKYYRPLVVCFGLVALQQITGQPSVLSYATKIFEEAGLAASASIAVALFKLVTTTAAALTVERFGRVKLLLLGCALMLVALINLSVSFAGLFDLISLKHFSKVGTLLAMFLYIGGYQVGFGPITWLMTSEVFPLAIRGRAVAVAVQLNFLLNAIVQFVVPVVQQWLGLAWTFGIFAVLDLLSLFFIIKLVPETKGLTLEEIEQLFEERPDNQGADNRTDEDPVAQSADQCQNC
ncbi:hypothetical protein ACA910_011454 [Epithemia clementina (nom. ined.)]